MKSALKERVLLKTILTNFNNFLTNFIFLFGSLKSNSHLSKKICFVYFNESPLEMMKNAFYFISKALFDLKIFKFLSRLFGLIEKNRLIINKMLI